MRYMCIFLLTLLLGSSLAIQNGNGSATPAATSNKEQTNTNNSKRDSSSATAVPTSNTGYRYSGGPAHHYLPPTAQSAPSPAPSHQHQEEGYKYQAPVVHQAPPFSSGGSALYQHSSQTPALAVNLEHAAAEKLPQQTPSYYVPKAVNGAERPENFGSYYTPNYFVPRAPTHAAESQTEVEHNKGYEYAKPSATQFAGYHYKDQEQALNIATHGPSSPDYNNNGQQQEKSPFANQVYNKIPNYAKPSFAPQIPSHAETSISSINGNGNGNIFKYPVSSLETTQTKDESFSHGYRYQSPVFVSSQAKEESFASHRQPFTSSNAAALQTTSKPLFEATNGNEVYNGFNYKQEPTPFESEPLGSNAFEQNSYTAGNSYFNKPVDAQANIFASQFNYSPYAQQSHNVGYAYPTPTQIPTQIPTQNPISSQTPHPLTSFSHNFPGQPASTFDLPYTGPVGNFAAQTPAVPAPTYLPASVQHGTSPTQHYASGHEELGGYYSHALKKPLENSPLNYEKPSTHLLVGERYPQQASSSSSANGLDYLQMQSHSYQLPSYYTMQMEIPAEHQPQFQQPQQPQEFSYHSSPNTQNLNSFAASVHQQPHAVYGTPNVEATQATPANAYLPPSGQFQPPYFIK